MDTSMMAKHHSVYQPPKLGTNDIRSCFSELGINISKEELLKPEEHRDSVAKLLEFLAEIITGISREEWSQPAFSGLGAFSFPELHEESVPHLNALRAIMRMMEICNVQDFTIRDLTAPNASRLNRQLSAIINCAKFREERLQLLNELTETSHGLVNQLQEVQEKHEVLNNRLTLLHGQTADETQQITSLETENKELLAKIAELKRSNEALDHSNQSLAESYSKVSGKVQEMRENYSELANTQTKLTAQVVTSPEKFRNRILEVGNQLQHESKDGKLAERKMRELSAWLLNVEEAQSEVSLAYESIQELRQEVEKQKAMINELDGRKTSIDGLENQLSELQQTCKQSMKQAANYEEKLAKIRKTMISRSEENAHNLAVLSEQSMEAEAFRVQVKGRAERLESETKRLEKELEAEVILAEQEIADIQQGYQRLEKKVIRHLVGMQSALESTLQDSQQSTSCTIGSNGGVSVIA